MVITLIILYYSSYFFFTSEYYKNNSKYSNFFSFILISSSKIIIGLIAYIFFCFYSNKYLDFQHFEARVFWKLSISFFYLALTVYSFYKKDKNSFNKFIFITFAIISLIGLFLLLFFSQKRKDKWEIIGIYLTLSSFEITFFFIGLYEEKNLIKRSEYEMEHGIKFLINTSIDWKINKIDFYRYQFSYIQIMGHGLGFVFYLFKEEIRCCRIFCNNFHPRPIQN